MCIYLPDNIIVSHYVKMKAEIGYKNKFYKCGFPGGLL